ncbi:MAG: hypothetical protein ABSD39_11500 [Terriglobales bacterium]
MKLAVLLKKCFAGGRLTAAAKATTYNKPAIAALKALRHPKANAGRDFQ